MASNRDTPEASLTATILVVDDDTAIRGLLARRLEAAGYGVELAAGGEEGLALVDSQPIDMVILDIMMPGLGGFEVLDRLRRRFDPSHLPVIVLSARTEGEDVVRALHAGANDYAIKPVSIELFLKRVATHLALSAGRGRTIGGYRINQKLGAGGMGVVFAAEDPSGGGTVAVKVLSRSMTITETNVRRFRREAELAARVEHTNLVRIHEAGQDGEIHFLVMELVEGETLRRRVEREPLPPEKVAAIGRQLAAGLAALAEHGVVHRDVKPGNVLLTRDGVAKLTDFGIARDLTTNTRLTRAGVGVGSLAYASPEQIRGHSDLRSDIFSLGGTMFFALTGLDPCPAKNDPDWILAYKLHNLPRVRRIRPEVPAWLAAAVERMLAPEPDDRYPSFEAVADALASGAPARRRRWWPWCLAVAGAGVAVGGAVWLAWPLLLQLIRSATE